MLTTLSIAALWARWSSIRAGAGRFLNGNAGVALGLAVVVTGLLVGLWWLRHDAAVSATAARDATWTGKLAEQRAADLVAQRDRDRRAEEKAAAERARLEAERDAAVGNAAELERKLAAAERGAGGAVPGDPVILPRDLVRSLRK